MICVQGRYIFRRSYTEGKYVIRNNIGSRGVYFREIAQFTSFMYDDANPGRDTTSPNSRLYGSKMIKSSINICGGNARQSLPRIP